MFGFVNLALQRLIENNYGEEKWIKIRDLAGIELEGARFLIRTMYEDEWTYRLLAAAKEELGVDNEFLLRLFGEEFMTWCQTFRYNKLLMLLGGTIQEFLANLDALHDHLANEYPGMRAPSFRCEAVTDAPDDSGTKTMILHYYSERAGLHDVVIGIVRAVAERLYNDVTLRIELQRKEFLQKNGMGEAYHAEFLVIIKSDEASGVATDGKNPGPEAVAALLPSGQMMGSKTFCWAFPFHMVLDEDMIVLQAGVALQRIMPWDMSGAYLPLFNDYFQMARPYMENVTFDNIIAHIHTAFVINRKSASEHQSGVKRKDSGLSVLRLKGQMIHDQENGVLLYLCSPRVGTFNNLKDCGFAMCDIPVYDATRELVLNSGIFMVDHKRMHELEVKTDRLRQKQMELETLNKRLDGLLYSILPVTVADRLRNREIVEPEKFDTVTVLFSDIVEFTKIGQQCPPIKVVNMLQELYSFFDNGVRRNSVYKVETIGDAYVVVGGLPEKNDCHAVNVVNQALDMVDSSRLVMHPFTNKRGDIKIRVGVHSGMVYAGVVGTKMPRYCLFGRSVSMAHNAEQTGRPYMVKITEATHSLLGASDSAAMYEYEPCDKNIPFPGSFDREMTCLFVKRSEINEFQLLEPVQPTEWMKTWLSSSRHQSPAGSPRVGERRKSRRDRCADRSPLVVIRSSQLDKEKAVNASPSTRRHERKIASVLVPSEHSRSGTSLVLPAKVIQYERVSSVFVEGRWYWLVHSPLQSRAGSVGTDV
eukprot:m.171809 g.171809  ORF g.171809 m.171809 type:complete len:759 (+) comp39074_c0_seq18:349-2625(+)